MKPNQLTRRTFLGTTAATALATGVTLPEQGTGPHLSACIEALFPKRPWVDRLEDVKAVGLTAFEFWGWRRRDLDALARKKDELGLTVAIFSCDTGGALVAPGSAKRLLPGLRDSITAAKKLGSKRLIATVGQERKDIARAEQHKNIVEACKAGAPLLEDAGITLCLEPLNVLVNHRGYYLATSEEAFAIVDEVGSPRLRILFDIYHQQITEGNLIHNITRNIEKIGHFHVADVPGRHEPGTGEINYGNVFRSITKKGFTGYLGLEMWPVNDHRAAVKETKAVFDAAIRP